MFTCISFWLCAFLLIQGCNSSRVRVHPIDPQDPEKRFLKIHGISREEAIALANMDAKREYRSLSDFKIVSCEQSIFWRIIYDGGGPEYVIDKASGRIIRKQKIPQGTSNDSVSELERVGMNVSQKEAIAAAEIDALETYGTRMNLDQAVVFACEQSRVWRVIFDYELDPGESIRDVPHGAFPKYVIDKKTGRVLYKELN